MHVQFSYEPRLEVFPLKYGLKSINDSSITALAQEAVESGINTNNPDEVSAFITAKIAHDELDIVSRKNHLQFTWNPIERRAENALKSLFLTNFDPGLINGYLTIGDRCPYNFVQRFFYVPAFSRSPVQICIHELMHFYTHQLIEPLFSEAGALKWHNDFKEALTVLVNTEFLGMIENEDTGYPQHDQLRSRILQMWGAGKSIHLIAQDFILEHQHGKI